jgi:hypothetical protein
MQSCFFLNPKFLTILVATVFSIMSFGFSPSDIVLFISFATKVVRALKQKGGSKSEYQLAERQCQDFLAVMEDIKHLDLSNIPEPFRSKIEEYATHTREFVTAFKQMINVSINRWARHRNPARVG